MNAKNAAYIITTVGYILHYAASPSHRLLVFELSFSLCMQLLQAMF